MGFCFFFLIMCELVGVQWHRGVLGDRVWHPGHLCAGSLALFSVRWSFPYRDAGVETPGMGRDFPIIWVVGVAADQALPACPVLSRVLMLWGPGFAPSASVHGGLSPRPGAPGVALSSVWCVSSAGT